MTTRSIATRAAVTSGFKKGGDIERFVALSGAEKAAAVSRYERGLAEWSDMTRARRKRWEASTAAACQARAADKAVRQSAGRSAFGKNVKSVQVTIEGELLARATAYAKAKKISRSQLFAAGLLPAMADGAAAEAAAR